jgi:hypothetical protein
VAGWFSTRSGRLKSNNRAAPPTVLGYTERVRRSGVTLIRALLALLVAFWPVVARADLGRDVEALTLAWSAFGHVTHLEPRLLERGDVLPLVLPVEALDPKSSSCVTLAVLGTSNLQFLLDPGRRSGEPPLDWPDGSLAGALELTRCGPLKPSLAALAIEMRSPRGVLEFLLVSSAAEQHPPPLTLVLPGRDPGPVAQIASSGPRPIVAPRAVRLRALEERAAREHAIELTTLELTAGPMGMGVALVTLAPGCHQFDLLGEESERRATDVDLEVTEVEHSQVLAADHGESSDGDALVCVAAATPVAVRFAGVAPSAKLSLVRARWDLDPSLPARWPGDARARMSGLLRSARRTLGAAPLVDEALGIQGDTLASIAVEPGACYLALTVALHGEVAAISMAAQAANKISQSRVDPDVPGAGVSFCAGAENRVLIEVDARGLGLTWMSAVWQIGRMRLGEAPK